MKILSFDCESNGLHGYTFAIGAVVLDVEKPEDTSNRFMGYVDIRLFRDIDEWVEANVLPHVIGSDLELYDTLAQLYDAFWDWFLINKQDVLVFSDFGYPVETNFLSYLQKQDKSRHWQGPYPLHDVGTLLLAAGASPDRTNRREWFGDMQEFGGQVPMLYEHNPFDDALASGWCAIKALRCLLYPNVKPAALSTERP